MSGSFVGRRTAVTASLPCHKKIVGTVEQYPDEDAARRSLVGLVSELNADGRPMNSGVPTIAQLCDHFEQCELSKNNTWRSHATKKIYQAYLSHWIRPPLAGQGWRPALLFAPAASPTIRSTMQ